MISRALRRLYFSCKLRLIQRSSTQKITNGSTLTKEPTNTMWELPSMLRSNWERLSMLSSHRSAQNTRQGIQLSPSKVLRLQPKSTPRRLERLSSSTHFWQKAQLWLMKNLMTLGFSKFYARSLPAIGWTRKNMKNSWKKKTIDLPIYPSNKTDKITFFVTNTLYHFEWNFQHRQERVKNRSEEKKISRVYFFVNDRSWPPFKNRLILNLYKNILRFIGSHDRQWKNRYVHQSARRIKMEAEEHYK